MWFVSWMLNVYGVTKSISADQEQPPQQMSVEPEAEAEVEAPPPYVSASVIRPPVTTRPLASGVPTNKSARRNSLGVNHLEDPANVLVMKPPVLALLTTTASGALSLTNVSELLKVARTLLEAEEVVEVEVVLVKT
jgi:hypothetical protein